MAKTNFKGGWSFPAGNNPNAQGMIWTGALPPTKAQWKTLYDKMGEDVKVDERSLVGKFDANYMGREDWRGNEFYILQELYKAGIAGTDPEVTHHYRDKKGWHHNTDGEMVYGYIPGGVYHRWTDKNDHQNFKVIAGDATGFTDYFLNADGIAVRSRRVREEIAPKERRKKQPKKPAAPKAKIKSVDQALDDYGWLDKGLVQGIAASLALSAVLGVVMWVLLF